MSRKQDDIALVEALFDLVGPLRLRYCPLAPSPRQEAFLLLRDKEVFFGGAAGGGKSVALLMSALQYCDVPGYHALLLRPSLTELQLPGGLIDLSQDWLAGSRAQWNGDTKSWRFPGPGRRSGADGASLGFGYLTDNNDLARYAGTSYSYLGFDELTRLAEPHYRRMFRVLRQPDRNTGPPAAADGTTLTDVPVRIRAASNPGGPGHNWVKTRFVDPPSRHRNAIFLPSRLADNQHLNQADYIATLAELPTAERERLLNGNWQIPDDGELFQRHWFEIIEPHQLPDHTRAVRYWDLAGTEPSTANRDPDYTVGLRLDLHTKSGNYYITDIVRARKAPGAIEQLVAETARRDGRHVAIRIEQEPGAAGKALADRYHRHVLRGYNASSRRETGAKDIRARPVAAAAENGLIKIIRNHNTNEFLDELTAFPHAPHDDCVDALSGAHTHLSRNSGTYTSHVPHGTIPRTDPNRNRDRLLPYSRDPIAEFAARLGARLYPSPPS
jgi:predicted phage terminase large subunit-like protein